MRVLDVGSGYNPDPRAMVLVERYLAGDDRSPCDPALRRRPGQILVQADIEHLPFRDNAFDVVLCFQTIEHVANPGLACAELCRVGRVGFLTAPSEQAMREDVRKGQRLYHKWMVKQEPHSTYGTRLRFYPRSLVPQLPMGSYPDRHVIMFWIEKFTWEVEE